MTQIERLQHEGIRRLGSPQRGFRYVTAAGKPVPAPERERIQTLKIPPAWTDVHIAPSARTRLQAVGRDGAGRWQYRYHARHREQREALKFEKVLRFGQALPRLRRRVAADLRRPGLGREKVMACLLRILGSCFIRPGSQRYAEENGSFGLATLRRKHVQVHGDTVEFRFRGKAGKEQHRVLKDRQVARIVRACAELPGRDLFKFVLDDGAVVDVRRRHINEYIQEVLGPDYSAKDFRTWAGTLICASALARAVHRAAPRDKRLLKRTVTQAVKETAEHLGNTPAVARASYIYPPVLQHFEEKGKTVERFLESVDELARHERAALHASEKALLELLKADERAAAAATEGT